MKESGIASVVRKLALLVSLARRVHGGIVSIGSLTARVDSVLVVVAAVLLLGRLHDLLLLLEHLFVEVFVVVVAEEGLLDVLLVQQLHVLLDLLTVLVLPLGVGVVRVKVVLVWRDKWGLEALM